MGLHICNNTCGSSYLFLNMYSFSYCKNCLNSFWLNSKYCFHKTFSLTRKKSIFFTEVVSTIYIFNQMIL